MENFTPLASLMGGILIGLAALLLMLFNGKIMGYSGIFHKLFQKDKNEFLWRLMFIVGSIIGGAIIVFTNSGDTISQSADGIGKVAIAGLVVGVGTKLGNGCTSGHGICGIGRFSFRSIIAVMTFLVSAIIYTYIEGLL